MASHTVKSSGGDYTSLSAWESDNQRDMVAAADGNTVTCFNLDDTVSVTIAGWTGNATYHITIQADGDHGGAWNTGVYRRGAFLHLDFNGGGEYTEVYGLQGYTNSATGSCFLDQSNQAGDVLFSKCIAKSTHGTPTAGTMFYHHRNGTTIFENCLAYDGYRGFQVDTLGTGYILNCGAHNLSDEGIRSAGTVDSTAVVKNSWAQGCGTDFSANWDTATHNASEDGTEPGTDGQTGAIAFVDEGADDFHLASGDTIAKENGADLSAYGPHSFPDDINGNTRTDPWDIGPDERVWLTEVTITCAGDIVVVDRLTAAVDGDIVLNYDREATCAGDIALVAQPTLELDGDLIVVDRLTIDLAGDTLVVDRLTVTADGDIVLNVDREVTCDGDIHTVDRLTITADGDIVLNVDREVTCDGDLIAVDRLTAAIDGDIRVVQDAIDIDCDGDIVCVNRAVATTDGDAWIRTPTIFRPGVVSGRQNWTVNGAATAEEAVGIIGNLPPEFISAANIEIEHSTPNTGLLGVLSEYKMEDIPPEEKFGHFRYRIWFSISTTVQGDDDTSTVEASVLGFNEILDMIPWKLFGQVEKYLEFFRKDIDVFFTYDELINYTAKFSLAGNLFADNSPGTRSLTIFAWWGEFIRFHEDPDTAAQYPPLLYGSSTGKFVYISEVSGDMEVIVVPSPCRVATWDDPNLVPSLDEPVYTCTLDESMAAEDAVLGLVATSVDDMQATLVETLYEVETCEDA